MYKHILCPVDGSPTSNLGMREAIRLDKDQGAKLRFFHVIDTYFPVLDMTGDFNIVYMADILQKYSEKVIKKAKLAAEKEGVAADYQIAESVGGRVAPYIEEETRKWPADLIVMGTHGLRGFSRLVMGSDAENVLRSSLVPVLLVRNPREEGQ